MKKLLLGVMLFAGLGFGFAKEISENNLVNKDYVGMSKTNQSSENIISKDLEQSVLGICLGAMLLAEKVETEEQGVDGNTYEVTRTYYHFVTYYYTCNQ